jgi:hypothetical protein
LAVEVLGGAFLEGGVGAEAGDPFERPSFHPLPAPGAGALQFAHSDRRTVRGAELRPKL